MKLFVTILLIVTAVSSGISLIQARQKIQELQGKLETRKNGRACYCREYKRT